MRSLAPLVSILMFPVIAAAGGEVVIQGDISPSHALPAFDHGYLAVYEPGGTAVYAPDGSPAMKYVSPPDVLVKNADIDSDGSVAIAVDGYHSEAGRILLFSPDGAQAGQIETGAWVPSQVCFAPDHSVWALGNERVEGVKMPPPDYFLLRHYSRGGNLLGQFLRRSAFPAYSHNPGPAYFVFGAWGLRIAGGRIGMRLFQTGENERDLWVEADLTGEETGRWTMTSGRPAAMTESGAVFAQGKNTQGTNGLSTLDRASGTWKAVQESSDDTLLGAEGNTLVFRIRGTNRIRRAMQP
jgi:hypothetical protein